MGEEPLELSPEDREWLKANWHYTDEEIDSLTAEQRRRFLALRGSKVAELLRKGRMIAEVVESHNCFIGPKFRYDRVRCLDMALNAAAAVGSAT